MSTPVRTAALAAVAFAFVTTLAYAAPVAKQYQAALTSPPFVTGATIKITKPSKVIVKVGTGSVTFQLKIGGITDAMDALVTNVNNTFQVDVIRPNGALATAMFSFDITNGKVSQKFPLANSSFPGGALNAGETIDVRAVRLIQGGNGNSFGVAGLTLK